MDTFYKQEDQKSCGLCAVNSVLAMYNLNPTWFDTSKGSDPKVLTRALRRNGLYAEPMEIEFKDLKDRSIAYFPKEDHYVAILNAFNNGVLLNDSLKTKTEFVRKSVFENKWLKDGVGWVIKTMA